MRVIFEHGIDLRVDGDFASGGWRVSADDDDTEFLEAAVREERIFGAVCAVVRAACRGLVPAAHVCRRVLAVLVGLAARRRELVVAAVAIRAGFCRVCAEDHGAQGREACRDDGDCRFNHRHGAR